LDKDYHGEAEALGYKPGQWTPLRLRWCRQRLMLRLGDGPELASALEPGPLDLELSAQDLELGLSPAR
jgi:hypothetical protein